MAELDVTPVQFKVKARPMARVGVAPTSGAQVIIVPVPGGRGDTGPPGEGIQIFGETPTGLIDNSNTVFTVVNNFLTDSTGVYLNGLREINYTETGVNQITLDNAPLVGDVLRIDYIVA